MTIHDGDKGAWSQGGTYWLEGWDQRWRDSQTKVELGTRRPNADPNHCMVPLKEELDWTTGDGGDFELGRTSRW